MFSRILIHGLASKDYMHWLRALLRWLKTTRRYPYEERRSVNPQRPDPSSSWDGLQTHGKHVSEGARERGRLYREWLEEAASFDRRWWRRGVQR